MTDGDIYHFPTFHPFKMNVANVIVFFARKCQIYLISIIGDHILKLQIFKNQWDHILNLKYVFAILKMVSTSNIQPTHHNAITEYNNNTTMHIKDKQC